jgi:poly(3-hydroxybutyrate) depolymerase
MRWTWNIALVVVTTAALDAAVADFSGEWDTDLGRMVLEQTGRDVEGTYGEKGGTTLTGRVDGRRLTFRYTGSKRSGSGFFEIGKSRHRFRGEWKTADGSSGLWRGWRQDPNATRGRTASFAGYWRTTKGVVLVEQKKTEVSGTYAAQGWGTFTGTVEGRRMTYRYKSPFGTGEAWAELAPDGESWVGSGQTKSSTSPTKWLGQRLEGHTRKVRPKPGTIVRGITGNKMIYYLRAPKGHKKGRPADAIVFLHGSNMSTRPYIETLASSWRSLAAKYVLIGIDGQNWSDRSSADNPVNNYTYVNWMGRSTYKGYPRTDRESPALVGEAVEELKKELRLDRIFIGGHSQGGFLSHVMHMHFPELFAGAFPMSCGLIMQCEPDVFDDEKLRMAQRATPLAIIHSAKDPIVRFSQGQNAHRSFRRQSFPSLRLFDEPNAGHRFAFLPVDDALAWLDALSTKRARDVLKYAKTRLAARDFRDLVALVRHAKSLKLKSSEKKAVRVLEKGIEKVAGKKSASFVKRIEANDDASWVDAFLEFRDDFEFAEAAKPAMDAYAKLRAAHEEPAKALYSKARGLLRAGQKDEGWKRYGELVAKYPASSYYRRVKRWIDER